MTVARNPPFTVGYSTIATPSPRSVEVFREQYRQAFGREPFFELSYTLRPAFLDEVEYLRGRVLSVHAPCPRTAHFPNLGSFDPEVVRESLETIRSSARTAARFGARFLVLHPGYTLDAAVPVDARRRIALLASAAAAEERHIWSRRGRICVPGYCGTPAYRRHRERAAANLREAARACAGEGVTLAVENLNPRISYLIQLPAEMVELSREAPELRLCVDLGHLWISSLVHGFGFTEGLAEILATGRVASVHIHDNTSRRPAQAGEDGSRPDPLARPAAPPAGSHFADDHLAIGAGDIPLRPALDLLVRAGVRRVVIESPSPPLENARRLLALIGEAG